jgi:hypothetical protein
VVVEPGEDLDVAAVTQPVVGEVGLPGFVGLLGAEPQDLGRLPGCGVTSPSRVRVRLTVETDTRTWWWWARCQAMVSAPASSPASVSCLRSRRISSTVLAGIAVGLVWGRLGSGSKAASPMSS